MIAIVTGATGTVGRLVVGHLVDAGAQVRAVTRRPDNADLPHSVDVVRGDLEQPHTIAPALEDADVVYLINAGEHTADVVDHAKSEGVSRIVTLSSATAGIEGHPAWAMQREFELAVEASGLGWTHIRPGMFAANLLDWADIIRDGRTIREPFEQARQTPVHEKDIAAVASAALLDARYNRSTYTLSGPESLSKTEQAGAISTAIGRTVHFEEISPRQWKQENVARLPEFVLEAILGYWSHALAAPEQVLHDVDQVLGRPAASLAEWASDHREDFVPTASP